MTSRDDRTRKSEARRERREARRAIAAGRDRFADDVALAQVVGSVVEEAGLAAGSCVTLYESYAGEPPTTATVSALRARGIRVLVPVTLPDLDLDWCDVDDPDRAPLGLDGIALADLVLAPGLSVDRSGTRIGQGGGCYDKALPRRRAGVAVLVLLHPGELLDTGTLPREGFDVPVDGVLTAEGLTRLG